MSEQTTNGIRVSVETEYLPGHSEPKNNLWFFAYHVTIENEGLDEVQLLSRHWVIRDANGHEEHVRGPGVVGSQPLIPPGGRFSYSSGCPLNTSMGSMHGTYQMILRDGKQFDAEIAPFVLVDPMQLN